MHNARGPSRAARHSRRIIELVHWVGNLASMLDLSMSSAKKERQHNGPLKPTSCEGSAGSHGRA